MYINLSLFFRAEYLSLACTRFSWRRWAYILCFTGLYALIWVVVACGRTLDYVLFPQFRKQRVREPVFIVAPPRSGTSLTQRLLSLDETRFVHNKLYQTILPAITLQRAVNAAVWLDQHTGRNLAKLVTKAEQRWFGGWDEMHRLRFDQPEEDDGFFVYTFVTEAVYLLFPHVEELWEAGFSDALPQAKRRKLMGFYRSCLQRQLFANGPGKTVLAKATQLSGAVHSLREEFPEAKFITIFRHPYEAVPSHVSVFYPVWQAHSPEITKDSAVSKAYALLAVRWYQNLEEFRREIDPRQFYCIDYRKLVCDPVSTIEGLYRHFNWGMSEGFRAHLASAGRRERRFKSRHHYSLEEFGLSEKWIEEELGEIIERHGLQR